MAATSGETSSKTWHGPPPPPELTEKASSLQLLSQGAEARIWLVTLPISDENTKNGNDDRSNRKRTIHVGSGINVPQLSSFSQIPSPLALLSPALDVSPPSARKIICKERFPKKYRYPQLDVSLTKSRTKGEARSLIRCQRAHVPCPNVLAIAYWSNKAESAQKENLASGEMGNHRGNDTFTTSSCLFLEFVEGCTVRHYFEQLSVKLYNDVAAELHKGLEPMTKRPRCGETNAFQHKERITTVIDSQTLCVAYTIGTLVAKMHAVGVIHGDLTTSNIMIRNPPLLLGNGNKNCRELGTWKPWLVLIDFGLATSTAASTSISWTKNVSGHKLAKPHKQQHNAEDKAVDLYVLERSFLSTHPDSELLVEEILRGYRVYFENLVCNDEDVAREDGISGMVSHSFGSGDGKRNVCGHVAKAVLNRLDQVRMRGRKRECLG